MLANMVKSDKIFNAIEVIVISPMFSGGNSIEETLSGLFVYSTESLFLMPSMPVRVKHSHKLG